MCTCEEALELISASLDGVLSKEEEQLLHEHLSQCPACRDLLADLEGIHESMPGLWVDPPSDLKDHIMERIQSSTVSPMPAGTSKRRWKGWAALAAVCAVAVLGAGSLKYLGLGGGSSGAAPGAEPAAAVPPHRLRPCRRAVQRWTRRLRKCRKRHLSPPVLMSSPTGIPAPPRTALV